MKEIILPIGEASDGKKSDVANAEFKWRRYADIFKQSLNESERMRV